MLCRCSPCNGCAAYLALSPFGSVCLHWHLVLMERGVGERHTKRPGPSNPNSKEPPRKIATLTATKEELRHRLRSGVRPPSWSEMSGGRSTLRNPRATDSGAIINIKEIVRYPMPGRRTHQDLLSRFQYHKRMQPVQGRCAAVWVESSNDGTEHHV